MLTHFFSKIRVGERFGVLIRLRCKDRVECQLRPILGRFRSGAFISAV